jgi:hypothetical protein
MACFGEQGLCLVGTALGGKPFAVFEPGDGQMERNRKLVEETGRAIEQALTRLTGTHELEGAPRHAEQVAGDIPLEQGGGWPWILSDMKSLLETGKSIAG